ncbi:MAG: molecular chaperone HtpG [Bacteriovoracaceae bacterium]
MTTRSGQIKVHSQDIFPIIKKWLYSEHDIFIRELVANATDAITKRATLSRTQNLEVAAPQINITINKEAKTITIKDNGIGLNEAEVEKYLAQLAFSGAEEFVNKMKDLGNSAKEEIIGKFGLGFYSVFMVAEKVVVESLSMNSLTDKAANPAVKWECKGDIDYTFSPSEKSDIGTSITIFVDEENKEFLEEHKLRATLESYCGFMPYPIYLEEVKAKTEDKKEEEVVVPEPINDTTPLWKKDPTTLTDEDYKNFYRKLYPMEAEPLFWIHLNVDHPFTLQGVLFFPKLNPNKPVNESNIKLYCKQVFVSDNVKKIIPEFLSLLKGVIDSTDIPLNVSRSSLQGDPNVKKISNYVIKKVAESLKKLFNNDRTKYETIWEDIGLFVKYGSISDTKFDEMMREFVLFKNSSEKLVTLTEYSEQIPESFKEKLKNKVIYFENAKSDPSLKKQLLQENIQVIHTDSYLDPHFMQHAEVKKLGDKETRFVGIDSEFENLLTQENTDASDIEIQDFFKAILSKTEKKEEDEKASKLDASGLDIEIKKYKNNTSPAYIKVDEQMKRFQQMTKSMGNTGFSMPIKKTLVVNPGSPLIQNALKLWQKGNKELVSKICHHVQDLAQISSEGFNEKEKDQFVIRTQELISELSNFAI